MCISAPIVPPFTIDGEALECVAYFTYLGSLMEAVRTVPKKNQGLS